LSELLSDLTPAQREAAEHRDGPLLVVAGAGSGKTRVVTRRVAYLIEQGVRPHEVLAITFTNKAATEMRERIERLAGGARVWVSTFHSFCARLLRRYAAYVGYRRDFTILDDGDQRLVMREALIQSGTDPKLVTPPKALYAVERLKDQLLTPEQALEMAEGPHEVRVARAYAVYQGALSESQAMDFCDLLMQAVLLLRQDEVREQLDRRFRYVLIDEYQDTNHAQYQLARLLAKKHNNLCATGDPDQSIYGWRGADVQNILRFERDFPGARTIRLEENFRSTQLILDAANGIISYNRDRHEKTLRSHEPVEGRPVEFAIYDGENEEARGVAKRIQSHVRRGDDPEEIAVLYRVGALSRSLETALRQHGVDHRVVGSVAFYQRREVKDVIAYLRVVQNPSDEVALKRVINVPARGVGKGTLAKVTAHARAQGCNSFEAALDLSKGKSVRSKRSRAGLARFGEIIGVLRENARHGVNLERLLRDVLAETGYRAYVTESAAHTSEEQDRLSNLEALCAAANDFDIRWRGRSPLLSPEEDLERPPAAPKRAAKSAPPAPALPLFAGISLPEPDDEPQDTGVADAHGLEDDESLGGIAAFLEFTALVSAAEEEEARRDLPKVSLMTIHAAKGLEFESVYLIGWEDGLFPHSRALEEGEGYEEERRLAYVAITRAKRRLVITRSRWRRLHGESKPQLPSPFLAELPAEAFEAGRAPLEIERGYAIGRAPVHSDDYGIDEPHDFHAANSPTSSVARRWDQPLAPARSAPKRSPRPTRSKAKANDLAEIRKLAQALVDRDESSGFGAGDRVYHEHFGRGKVLSLRGRKLSRKIEIEFESHGVKTLVLQYARMRKLGDDE
jgi:DNA helicase-2/ATP-dependent DNA helicase PcrA